MSKAAGAWGDLRAWPIVGIHSVVMDDGRVLTFGTDAKGMQGGQFIYDIYNPVTGQHETLENTTTTDIFCSAAMIIPGTDKVLIAGGDGRPDGLPNTGVNDVNILDMRTGELYAAPDGDMVNARWYPTMISTHEGEMVMLGGSNEFGQHQATPEIYTPGQGWTELTGATDQNLGRDGHYPRAFLDTDGNIVYYSTGRGGNGEIEVMSLDTSGNGSVTQIGTLPFNATWENPAVMFDVGKILIQDSGSGLWVMDINGDGVTFEQVGDLGAERNWSNMTTLPDGMVLINGGSSNGNAENGANYTATVFDPETGTLTELVDEMSPRLYHSTTVLLQDGTILSTGGGAAGFSESNYLDAQIYKPYYLYDADGNLADRPEITYMKDQVIAGEYIVIQTPDHADITKVTMVKNGAATHAFNMGTGFVELGFEVSVSGSLYITVPGAEAGLSSGDWMVFIWDKDGVPSIAENVQVLPPHNPGTMPHDGNLLVNGSLEITGGVNGQEWLPDSQLEGWTSSTGTVQGWEWNNGDPTVRYTDGNNAVSIDGDDGAISQTVNSVRGQTYDLWFDYSIRSVGYWNAGIEVIWNGEVVETIKPGHVGFSNYHVKVVGEGNDTLAFKATDGTHVWIGGVLDNIKLVSDGTPPIDMPPVDPVDPDPIDPDPVDPDPVEPDPVDPTDPVDPPASENLIVNSSFERPDVNTSTMTVVHQMEGWTSSNGQFEVWKDGFEGIIASDGSQSVEIDSERGDLSQTIQTEAGRVYDLDFAFEARDNVIGRAGIEVLWNDEVVSRNYPENGDPQTYWVQVVGTGGQDEITFRAASDTHFTVNGVLDNIELTATDTVIPPVDPVDPVDPPVDPVDPVDPDPVDPDPVDPDPVDPDPAPTENLVYNVPGEVQHLKGSDDQIDVFVVSGKSSDFNWGDTQDGEGTVIWKGGDFDVMHGFDVLRFDDMDVSITKADPVALDPDAGGITVNDIKGQTQHLQGTDDIDTFVVDAVSTDYGWGVAQDGEGAVVWSGSDFDVLHDFEQIQFEDMTVTLDH